MNRAVLKPTFYVHYTISRSTVTLHSNRSHKPTMQSYDSDPKWTGVFNSDTQSPHEDFYKCFLWAAKVAGGAGACVVLFRLLSNGILLSYL